MLPVQQRAERVRKAYEPPSLTILGEALAVTRGGHHGADSDGIGFAFHTSA